MCDTIPGELLLCFRKDDRAADALREHIAMGTVPHISIIESLGDRLAGLRLSIRHNVTFHYYRLKVPPGQEGMKINVLYFLYRSLLFQTLAAQLMLPSHPAFSDSSQQMQVSRHAIL